MDEDRENETDFPRGGTLSGRRADGPPNASEMTANRI
jgi:hypothetical protein